MKSHFNSSEDFVLNESFRTWVNDGMSQEDLIWNDYMKNNPGQIQNIREAIWMVESLKFKDVEISDTEIERKIDVILNESDKVNGAIHRLIPTKIFKWAASIILILGIGILIFNQSQPKNGLANFIETRDTKTLEKYNSTNEVIHIILNDSSIVNLEPKSKITYPVKFNYGKREVFLEGSAFFNVTKNPNRPFIVYSNNLITKVLGTSFSIESYSDNTKKDMVKVITGKVSVISNANIKNAFEEPYNNAKAIILKPNQMVVFNKNDKILTKTLVENPIEFKPQELEMNFVDKPVSQVFKELEKAYNVEILFDNEQLSHCNITAPLSSETLYRKLDLICKVIQANYEIVDGQIVINSKGCK